MKNKKMTIIAGLMAAGIAAQAQYTWDVLPGTVGVGDSAITSSNGMWDATAGNWTVDGGANNVAWSSGADAVFGSGTYKVTIADAGVTVGAIDLGAGTGAVVLEAANDNIGNITVSGSPTWDLNGRSLYIQGNQLKDTKATVAAAETLTVVSTGGAGLLHAGEKANDADWVVGAGTTLDFQAATLRGCLNNVGQFTTVKLADGSTYIHERWNTQNYPSNWELSSGTNYFSSRYAAFAKLDGVISGSGHLVLQGNGAAASELWLNNAANTLSGGFVVEDNGKLGVQSVPDSVLGPVPGAVDPDYIVLRNGGALFLKDVTLNSNRGITLDGGGGIICANNGGQTNIYGGKITGTGDFQLGRSDAGNDQKLLLTGNSDYTGDTRLDLGRLFLGTDNALGTNGMYTTVGNNGNQLLFLNGFDQTFTGLRTSGNGTRIIYNHGASLSTLTLNVDASKTYNGNINGAGGIHIVKNGSATQTFGKNGLAMDLAGATVNEGRLRIDYPNNIETANVTVNDGGEFVLLANDSGTRWVAADVDNLLANATFNIGSMLLLHGGSGSFTYSSAISGVQGLGINGGNTRTLTAACTYTGMTYVEGDQGNTLALGGSATIDGTPEIQLRGTNAYFDVSAHLAYSLVAGQKLSGIGGVVGSLDTAATAIIHPGWDGREAGTLNVSGDLDISAIAGNDSGGLEFAFGTNWINSVDVGGTLTIGAGLLNYADFTFDDVNGMENGIYTLFSAGTLSGTLGAGLTGAVGTNGASGTISVSGTDIIMTVTGGNDYSPFGLWATGYGLSSTNATETADPDMDDIDNLHEYAFGGNPTNASENGNLPVLADLVQGGTNWFTYTYAYRTNTASGLTYELVTTPNLVISPWTNINHTVLGTEMIDADFASVTNGVDLDVNDQYFFQLLIENQ